MTQIGEILEFLKTLIHSSDHGTVRISKASLVDIRTCLHNVQENIEFLQLETKLQQEELQQKRHPSELVQNNPLFDFETGSYQQPASQ